MRAPAQPRLDCSAALPAGQITPAYSIPCFFCNAGRYASLSTGLCEVCPLHTYTNKSSEPNCTHCPPHSVTISGGSTRCAAGAELCAPRVLRRWMPERSKGDCVCEASRAGVAGYYKLHDLDDCKPCPLFATCGACARSLPGPSMSDEPAEGVRKRPMPLTGYWVESNVDNGDLLIECFPPDACPGAAISACSVGHESPRCGVDAHARLPRAAWLRKLGMQRLQPRLLHAGPRLQVV